MKFETTIEHPVGISGVGLHSGAFASMRLVPAMSGSGVVFRRPDLDDFTIPATWKYVARVSYATSLMREGVLLSTTEHLLSVLYAMGVDNVVIEIDNLETPILDGSGLPFVQLIREAGIKRLRRRREYLRVTRPVEVREGEKRVAVLPFDCFRIECETHFDHPQVGRRRIELDLTPERYAREIAPARTFGFEQDLEQMRDMGLIRGATLDNAVCFGPDGPLNPGGLRFSDEPCRHKVLDLIGDLALLGKPLVGLVVAEQAGHAMHAALVKKIMNDPSCFEIAGADEIWAEAAETAVGVG